MPAFFVVGLPQKQMAILALLLATVSVSVIDTWIYPHTAGSLVLMILVHLMTNHCFKMLGVSFGTSVAAGAVCALLIVLAGGLRGAPPARAKPVVRHARARGMDQSLASGMAGTRQASSLWVKAHDRNAAYLSTQSTRRPSTMAVIDTCRSH